MKPVLMFSMVVLASVGFAAMSSLSAAAAAAKDPEARIKAALAKLPDADRKLEELQKPKTADNKK